ncbi:MAG: PLD nuclease N-terminal domain-containing protein [Bacteroidota bacterium]
MLFIFGLLNTLITVAWLLFTIAVLVTIWRDKTTTGGTKALWTLAVLVFPILGPIAYLFFGKKGKVDKVTI